MHKPNYERLINLGNISTDFNHQVTNIKSMNDLVVSCSGLFNNFYVSNTSKTEEHSQQHFSIVYNTKTELCRKHVQPRLSI